MDLVFVLLEVLSKSIESFEGEMKKRVKEGEKKKEGCLEKRK